MVLICIFEITSDVEDLFASLLAICISFYEEMCFEDLCPVLHWITYFFLLSCRSLYILNIAFLASVWFANISSHYMGCLFTLSTVFFNKKGCFFLKFIQV